MVLKVRRKQDKGRNARVAQWWSIALPRRGSRVRIPSRAFFIAEKRVRKHETVLAPAGLTPRSECPRCAHCRGLRWGRPSRPVLFLFAERKSLKARERECISAEVPIYRDFRCFCGSRWQNYPDLYNGCFCDMIGFIKMQHIRR